jgi:4'-phosphopantetheinyl transferase
MGWRRRGRTAGILTALPDIAPEETLDPAGGIIDLWSYAYGIDDDPILARAQVALMTDAERARHDRFVSAADRRQFLATRALVRVTLSRYADVEPGAWRFTTVARGKPVIAEPTFTPALHFNLSNTHGLIVCAVTTRFPDLGVDVEPADRGNRGLDLADRYFSRLEVESLTRLAAVDRPRRFLSYWTLKESYIKARGLGLAIPLGQFSFLLDEPPPIRVAFDPALCDDAGLWRFALMDAAPNHLVAVGAKTGGADWVLRARRVVPLAGRAIQ